MIIGEYKGNVIDIFLHKSGWEDFPVLHHFLHGANCQNIMGAGIAKQVKRDLPKLFFADVIAKEELERAGHEKEDLAGTFSTTGFFRVGDYTKQAGNLYTQIELGKHAKLSYLEQSLNQYVEERCNVGDVIGVPRIGCGIGGLDWKDVSQVFEDCPAQIAVFTL